MYFSCPAIDDDFVNQEWEADFCIQITVSSVIQIFRKVRSVDHFWSIVQKWNELMFLNYLTIRLLIYQTKFLIYGPPN